MAISLELTPRSVKTLTADVSVAKQFPQITALNIPDIQRLKLRSTDAAKICQEKWHGRIIPHIRARGINPSAKWVSEFEEVLLVTGDPPQSPAHASFDNNALTLIKQVSERENVSCYGVLDPYRSSISDECAYLHRKLKAGFSGFFTQPVFDTSLIDLYKSILPPGIKIFWGIAPVLSENSVAWWRSTNKVVFPRDFDTRFEYAVENARNLLSHIKKIGDSTYLMPIRTDIEPYLKALFES